VGKLRVINYTRKPLELIGECASSCWGSKPSARIAKHCYEANHLRTFEYADLTIELDGYSARVIREFYTHVIGTTRLQASTRYINYEKFDYYTPPSIDNCDKAREVYATYMAKVSAVYAELLALGIPKEDIANILPLGHGTKVVIKINARALFHLAELRLCTRALPEFRDLVIDIKKALTELGNTEDGQGWEYISSNMVIKCIKNGFCDEAESCGIRPKK